MDHATNNHSDIADGRGREDMPTSVAEKVSEEPEEGSPEYIRRKYFLSALADGPSRVAHLCTPALHLFRYHTTPLALLSRFQSISVSPPALGCIIMLGALMLVIHLMSFSF